MKLAIFGATGGVGRQLVAQALAAGHAVTILARSPAAVGVQLEHVTVIPGSVTDLACVAEVVAGQDAVLSALGSTQSGPVSVCTNGIRTILAAMAQQQVRRLLVVSAYGARESHHRNIYNALLWRSLQDKMVDKEAMETVITRSDVEWTLVRPSFLTNGPRTQRYHIGPDLHMNITSRIARADVADFMLGHLTDAASVHQALAITA